MNITTKVPCCLGAVVGFTRDTTLMVSSRLNGETRPVDRRCPVCSAHWVAKTKCIGRDAEGKFMHKVEWLRPNSLAA